MIKTFLACFALASIPSGIHRLMQGTTVNHALTCPATFADVNWVQFRPAISGTAGKIDVRVHACLKSAGGQADGCAETTILDVSATGSTTLSTMTSGAITNWNAANCN